MKDFMIGVVTTAVPLGAAVGSLFAAYYVISIHNLRLIKDDEKQPYGQTCLSL
jgi:hypothetical protein